MTNEQRIREKISTIEGLAEYLITYDVRDGVFYTSNEEYFGNKRDAIEHEIEWLKNEYDGKW